MLDKLYNLLNSINGFQGKVAYRFFQKGAAPALPFICYEVEGSDNFIADNKVKHRIDDVSIDLYTKKKDTASEELVESALDDASIPWNKTESYIEAEECYMITYSIRLL